VLLVVDLGPPPPSAQRSAHGRTGDLEHAIERDIVALASGEETQVLVVDGAVGVVDGDPPRRRIPARRAPVVDEVGSDGSIVAPDDSRVWVEIEFQPDVVVYGDVAGGSR